jgi:uncharacterized protein (TIGR02246 family)
MPEARRTAGLGITKDRHEEDDSMKTRIICLTAFAVLVVLAVRPGWAEKEAKDKENAKDAEALFKRAEAFVEAFHKGNASAVAAFWTTDGTYTDQKGHHLNGRDAIEKAFKSLFAEHKGLKLRIDSVALRFVTPNVAVEDGTTEVIPPDGGPPSRARYTIVHVKKDDQWYLDSVREAAFTVATNYENLKALEWLIGEWDDDTDKGEIGRVTFSWAPNQNFIVSSYATTFKNVSLTSGTQWIGWDPTTKRIRSWTFDADGTFGEGTWTVDGDKLLIRTSAVLRDGKKVTATNTVKRLDADTVTWESRDRTLNGKELPDITAIKMKRRK